MRSMNLTKSVEGNILLVRIKCVLLAFMWGASIPWLAWKAAGMSMQLLHLLLTFGPKVSVAVMVMAAAYENGVP